MSSSSKNHNKKSSSSRDRNKSVASESGGSSQCDTPPLNEKVNYYFIAIYYRIEIYNMSILGVVFQP